MICRNAETFKSHVFVFIYVKAQLLRCNKFEDPAAGTVEIIDSRRYRIPIEKYLNEMAKMSNVTILCNLDCPIVESNIQTSVMPINNVLPNIPAKGSVFVVYAVRRGDSYQTFEKNP
jgi:hypothetical protein